MFGSASYCAVCCSCEPWAESGLCRILAGRGGGGASRRDPPGWRPAQAAPPLSCSMQS